MLAFKITDERARKLNIETGHGDSVASKNPATVQLVASQVEERKSDGAIEEQEDE